MTQATGGTGVSPKTFVLGAGAQKGGTTWLYKYLRESDQFAHGYRKEYHVFDTVDLPSAEYPRNRNLALAESALADLRSGRPADGEVLHRISMVADTAFYFDYFAGLLRGDPTASVTADVTPGYAMLSTERFRAIRLEFQARDVRTVPVFLMRDPVERMWSQVRMQHRRASRSPEELAPEHLLNVCHEPRYASRSEYHRTLDALDATFGDATHFAFYERLFSMESIRELCEKIGVTAHDQKFDARANAAPSRAIIPEHIARPVAESLSEVYVRVARRFPDFDVTATWPHAMYVL